MSGAANAESPRSQNSLNFFLYLVTMGLMRSRVPLAECTLPGRSFCCQTVTITCETENRMKTILPEMPVVSHLILVSMRQVFSGVYIQDQALLVFLFKKRVC